MSKEKSDYKLYLEELEKAAKRERKPSLLLHVCCAPCSCQILKDLAPYFAVTVYYTNDNIYPFTEYEKREKELEKYLDLLEREEGIDIRLVVPEYDNKTYAEHLSPYQDMPEFSERCWICYRWRLEKCFAYAKEKGYEYVASVMSVSRYKNAEKINEIGRELEKRFEGPRYLVSDFKKNKGEENSSRLAKELDLYRQDYCGCKASLKESKERKQRHKEAAYDLRGN